MPENGEDQRLQMFFKNVVRGFAELQTTQALQKQAELVASTIGGHVREVLGPVQEGVDVIKNTFTNTWGFVKGAMDDLGGFFGLDEKIEEKVYRATALGQGADIIEETKRNNDLFIQGQEASWDQFEKQMEAWAKLYDIDRGIYDETVAGFKEMYEQLGISTKIEKDKLAEEKKKHLEGMRETQKKDKTFFGRVFDFIMLVIFGPFALIAGAIAGFVAMFTKVLFAPLRALGTLGRALGFLPKLEKPIEGAVKSASLWQRLGRALGFLPKLEKPIEGAVKGAPRWLRWVKKIPFLGRFLEYLGKNVWIGKMFGLGKFVGSKILFPLFLFFDALTGLAKYKKIFGKGAGIREAIESAIAGIVSGFIQLPAKALDWTMKKLFGIETDFASYFSTEKIAKALHWIGNKFDEWIVKPIENYIKDPETEKTFTELDKATERARNAFVNMMKDWKDKLNSWWEKHFGEDARKKAQKEFEEKTPLQRRIDIEQSFPGEVMGGYTESKLSPEQLAARAKEWEGKGIGKWIKENMDVGKQMNNAVHKLSDTINTLIDVVEGKPGAAGKAGSMAISAFQMANPVSSAGAWAREATPDLKDELANPGVLLHNKQ
jgi:hypothetical protein